MKHYCVAKLLELIRYFKEILSCEKINVTSVVVLDAEMYPGVPDNEIVRPTSPEHAQMLSDARQYAAEATQRASETFSRQLAQATRRATEIGLRELTTRRRTGQSDTEATEHALDSARHYANQLTQQATDRLRHDTATGLRMAHFSARGALRGESESRSDNIGSSGSYDLGNIDNELENRARQVVADAVERARQREQQAVEVRQRAQHSISILDRWTSLTRRLNRERSEIENSSAMESEAIAVGLGDSDAEFASNVEENESVEAEDEEISIPEGASVETFDPASFTTETYDAELNNILGIETEVNDDEENIEASNEVLISEAEVNEDLVDSVGEENENFEGLGEDIGVSGALNVQLREFESNNSVEVVNMSDGRVVVGAANSATDSSGKTETLNSRGVGSPPPRHLPSAEYGVSVVGQDIGHSECGTSSQSDNMGPCKNSSVADSSKVQMSNNSQSDVANFAISSATSSNECYNSKANQELIYSSTSRDTGNPKSKVDKQPNILSGPSVLTRYLQAQKQASGSSGTSSSKATTSVFPSIRERLQTNIPLTSCDSTSKSSSVKVLSSRGEIPVVTVVSASECSSSSSLVSEGNRPVVAGWSDVLRTNAANVRTGLSTAISSSSTRSNLNSSSSLTGLSYPPIVPTVIASTSSHASLFQNIYHNSRGTYNYNTRGAFRGGQIRNTTLSSSRTQPYLQNRSRFMSLMGPYLESRGFGSNRVSENNPSRSTVASPITAAHTFSPAYSDSQSRIPYSGVPVSAANPPTQSNVLESSDTESELNTHLHNRAYFLPISEDQTRTVSSTSIQSTSSIESSDNVLRQRSVSRDSVDSVQGGTSVNEIQGQINSVADNFVQDMHRFSRNSVLESERQRQPNNPQNSNANSLFNRDDNNNDQDDNNNTIQVANNPGNTAQATQGSDSILALRDNLVTMTDQIEQEMNELNRRINSLRDSFNQSLQALRQDRERYQSLGQSLTDTNTNLTSIERAVRGENDHRGNNSNNSRDVPVIRVTGLEDPTASASGEMTIPASSQGNY